MALAFVVPPHSIAAAPEREVKRILILNKANTSYPAIPIINAGIQSALSNSPYRLEFYSEYLDLGLFPDPAVQQEFRNFYIRKYRNRQPDVIIAIGPTALQFMQEAHQTAFPGVPIVFCMPVGDAPSAAALGPGFTGVESDLEGAETLKVGLRLQPGTEHVVVLGGVSERDKHEQARLRQQAQGVTGHPEITFMTDVGVPELPERLRHLAPHTLILLLSFARDAEGNGYKSNEVGPLVAAAANAPVFTFYDVYLNHGEVGGYLSNLGEQGKVAGGMALRILRGERPQDIPRVKGANTYMFDWRAVRRWGLKQSEIPPGSIVLNRQPTVWESQKGYLVGGISLMLLEALLIGGLLRQRASRRKVETDLAVTNDRFRLALEAGRAVGWGFEARSGQNQWFGDLQAMFGISADNYSGPAEDFYRYLHPEDRERVRKAVADARQSRNPFMAEFRIVRADGSVRWATASGKVYYAKNGDPERMLGVSVDITDRKLAEETLRESEARFRDLAEQSRTTHWEVDPQGLFTYVSYVSQASWGYRPDEVMGRMYFYDIHPKEGREGFKAAMFALIERKQPFRDVVHVIETKDGRIVWGSTYGIPVLNADGTLRGYRGSCTDVTDRKLADEALASVGRRLIEAQEKERTWIARELHDDVNQRIVLLSLDLERWDEQLPDSVVQFQDHICSVRHRLLDLARDIQALSHRLHSSKLEYLGIVAAARSFCQELTEQHKVEIDFSDTNMPDSAPREISLCVFRVFQEALQNAVKHSGVRQFAVKLNGTAEEIQLTVSDPGVGFDPHRAVNGRGLGLISMRERLHFVGGQISIESQPGRGTTIRARVPLSSTNHAELAAG